MFRLISKFLRTRRPHVSSSADPEILHARELLRAGDPAQAEHVCLDVLAADPKNAEAYSVLGGINLQLGKTEFAVEHFLRAIDIDSSQAIACQGLGIAYCNLGQLPEAIDYFKQAIALEPKNPAAHSNLGNCYKQANLFPDATRCFKKSIACEPSYLSGYLHLAGVLDHQRNHKDSVKIYRKALRIGASIPGGDTNLVLLHHRLGLALRDLDETDEAIAHFKEAIGIQPDFALAHNSLGGAMLSRNELDVAMTCFRRALAIEPGYSRVHSNILLTLNYLSGSTQEQIYEEAIKFDLQHTRQFLRSRKPFRLSRNKRKILRIGYLSPDFRNHSVAHFTRQLPGQHNRDAVTVYCYSDVEKPDDLTGQFQAQADHWLSILDMDDEQVAQRVRQDRIDILVDLTGHTSKNRLLVFARKPAPIQVNWLGYPNTSGMKAMDYRLTDKVADPPGEADRLHVEKLVRLEHGFLCYQTEDTRPAVSPLPSPTTGHITFGSFNMIRKVTSDVIAAWSQILLATPGSRLLMKSFSLEDSTTKANLLRSFETQGVESDRLLLINAVPTRKEHLDLYSKVDIGLDPFPYNGTTTTFESLWMGVPVICLRGDRHSARVGASIMHHAGLPEMVAEDVNEYIELAGKLAGNSEELITIRQTLRRQLQESVLMDVPLFTETLEHTYRKMWVTWCNKNRK